MAAEQAARSLNPFDTLLTFATTLAVAFAIGWYGDGQLDTLDTAIAAAVALLVAGSAAFIARASRGIFLTPLLRLAFFVALSAACGVLFGQRPEAAVQDDALSARISGLDAQNQELRERVGSLEGRLQAKAGETEDLRAALQAAGEAREAALDDANAKFAEELVLRILLEQAEDPMKQQQEVPGAPPEPGAPVPSEDDILAKGLQIPPDQVSETRARLEGSPLGRNLVAFILGEAPLFGGAIAKLFGGGSKVRQTITTVVTLAEAGTIPPSADLEELFSAAEDAAALQADLYALADRAGKQGVLSQADVKEVKSRIEDIATTALTPLPSEIISAQTAIRDALSNGTACSVDITKPWFVAFATASQKRLALRRTSDEATRNCLTQFPPIEPSQP